MCRVSGKLLFCFILFILFINSLRLENGSCVFYMPFVFLTNFTGTAAVMKI
jgi:hypothetical protein